MEPSLLSNLLEAQESAWKQRRYVTVEELLARLGSTAEAESVVCDLVVGEIMLRRRRGDHSDLSSEIRSRFPTLPAFVYEMAARPDLPNVLPMPPTLREMGDTDPAIPVLPGPQQAPGAPAVAGYTLVQKIGEGGFGDVWIARNQLDGSPCAVKVLTQHVAAEIGSLQAYQARGGEHPHLITIRHAGIAEGIYYYVMPLADPLDSPHRPASADCYIPCSLRHWISFERRLPAELLCEILRQVLLGLQELHRQSLAHCDVKPDNLLRVGGLWKLADIGLAGNRFEPGERRGTRAYWPPERVGPQAADLYALGLTAFVAVTGRRPQEFNFTERDALARELRSPEGRRLIRLIGRACDPRPERRYASASEMLDDLLAPSPVIRTVLLAGAASTLLLLSSIFLVYRGDGPSHEARLGAIGEEAQVGESTAGPVDSLPESGGALMAQPLGDLSPGEGFLEGALAQRAREVRRKLGAGDRDGALRLVQEFLGARRSVPEDAERRALWSELVWVMDDPLEQEQRLRLLKTWDSRPFDPGSDEELEFQRQKLNQREPFVEQIPVHVALSKIELARLLVAKARVRQDARDAERLANSAFEILQRRFSAEFPAVEDALGQLPDLRWADYWRIEAQRLQGTPSILEGALRRCHDLLQWWQRQRLNQEHPEYAARLLQRAELSLAPRNGRPADPAESLEAFDSIRKAQRLLSKARDAALERGEPQLLVDFQFVFQKEVALSVQWSLNNSLSEP